MCSWHSSQAVASHSAPSQKQTWRMLATANSARVAMAVALLSTLMARPAGWSSICVVQVRTCPHDVHIVRVLALVWWSLSAHNQCNVLAALS